MMKVAIFENEYKSVKLAFEAANSLLFNNKLLLQNFSKSQEFDFGKMENFSVFFIDIDLSVKSDLDGYMLIKKFLQIDRDVAKKIVILTGNNKIVDGLTENGIDEGAIKNIIIKPTNFKDIGNVIQKVIKESTK